MTLWAFWIGRWIHKLSHPRFDRLIKIWFPFLKNGQIMYWWKIRFQRLIDKFIIGFFCFLSSMLSYLWVQENTIPMKQWNRVCRGFHQDKLADQLHYNMLIMFCLIPKFQPPIHWDHSVCSCLPVLHHQWCKVE